MSPADRRLATPALELLRGSGLDTSSGTDFIQSRIALLAAITTCVGGAFLVFSLLLPLDGRSVSFAATFAESTTLGHVAAVAVAGSIWAVCSRMRLGLTALGLVDGVGILVVCGLWAMRVEPERVETVYIGILAVTQTVL